MITEVPTVKCMAFICRSVSRSALRKQLHPKHLVTGTAFLGGLPNLLHSRPNYELGNTMTVVGACGITVHAGLAAQLKWKAMHQIL